MLIRKNYLSESQSIQYNLAIGNFDGIHNGHRYLLQQLKLLKKNKNQRTAVLSFIPHPVKVIAPNKWEKNLVKFRTKYNLLKSLGIDL